MFLQPQPPCSLVGAGRSNPQSFSSPYRSRSADFSTSHFLGIHFQNTPGSVHPFLTSPHSVCADRHPGNGVEAEGQGTTVYHNSLRKKHQIAAPPHPCMLIPQAPQSYLLKLCTHSVLSGVFPGVGEY